MTLIDGKLVANQIKEEIKQEVQNLITNGCIPCLAIVLVGNNPSSEIYVRNKVKLGDELQTKTIVHRLDESITEVELIDLIHTLNRDNNVHGILVQLPLPKHINEEKIINEIDPNKDVDCFTYINTAKL